MIGGGVLYYHQPAFSPNNKLLFVPCEAAIKVYSVKTGLLVSTLAGFHSSVTSVRVHQDKVLLACSLGGDVVAYDLLSGDGKEFAVLWRHHVKPALHQVVPLGDGDVLVVSRLVAESVEAAADTAFCRAYPKEAHSYLYRLCVATGELKMVDINLPGRAIVEYRDGYVFLADRQCATVATLDSNSAITILHQFKIKRAAMCMQVSLEAVDSADAFMAIGDGTGRITVWYYKHATSPHHHLLLHWHSDAVRSIACLPSGYLLSAGKESVLVLWRVQDQFKRFLPKIGDTLEHITVAHDWSRFAVSTRANKIVFVEAASFRVPEQQPAIVGISGFGVGCRVLGDAVYHNSPNGDESVIVYKGANGTIQAHDILKDRQVGEVAAVELLLTDPTGSSRDNAHVPEIEAYFVASQQWMATVEGRPGIKPHFGYLKLWERQASYDFQFTCHTIIHRPHTGPVSSVLVKQLTSGEWLCVTISPADTFKLFKLDTVYDEARLTTRPAWRPFYADAVKAGPTAVALSDDGKLAVAYEHAVVVLGLAPLLSGTGTHPVVLSKLKMKGMKRPINKLQFAGDTLLAATNYDIFKMDLTVTSACPHWSVQNRALSVSPTGDRLSVLAVQPADNTSWLLEFRLSDFSITGRRQLEGVGRAILSGTNGTVAIHGDGCVTLFGIGSTVTDTAHVDHRDPKEEEEERAAKRQRIIKDSLTTHAPTPSAPKQKRAAPCKSRLHLCALLGTSELPSVRDIFSKFILPRIRI